MKRIINRIKTKYLLVIICLPVIMLINTITVFANEEDAVDFSVKAILPENQLNKNYTYFDLRMEPSQKQTIEVLVSNTSLKEGTYTVNVNQAYTNKQGFIDYAEKDVKLDSSLKYPIKDIVHYENKVTVPAQQSVKVPIEIQMPQESFDGQLLAGIQITKNQSEKSNQAISNEIGYVLGLKLTETDNPVKRDIQLEKVNAAVSYGKTSVVAKLRNPTMDAIGKLKYVVDIKNEKNGESVKKVTYDSGMEMAPNSTYDFAIDWAGERLVAGDYTLGLVITDARDDEWKFNEKFTITAKEANDINKITVDVNKKVTPIWVYILIGLAILLIILVIVFLIVNRKKKQEEAKKNRKKLTASKKKGVKKGGKQKGAKQRPKKNIKKDDF